MHQKRYLFLEALEEAFLANYKCNSNLRSSCALISQILETLLNLRPLYRRNEQNFQCRNTLCVKVIRFEDPKPSTLRISQTHNPQNSESNPSSYHQSDNKPSALNTIKLLNPQHSESNSFKRQQCKC